MIFDPITRTVTLEPSAARTCYFCHEGTQPLRVPCPTGGRGPRGGRDGCRTCHGSGTHFDQSQRVPCPRCDGTGIVHEQERSTDRVPDAWLTGEHVTRECRVLTREMPQAVSLLGHGCVGGACVDYGRTYDRVREAVRDDGRSDAARVRALHELERSLAADPEYLRMLHHVQACNVVRDGRLCDRLVLAVWPQGYGWVAQWEGALQPA